MSALLLSLEILILLALLALFWRLLRAPGTRHEPALARLLEADVPRQLLRAEQRDESVERLLRGELARLREEHAAHATRLQETSQRHAEALRAELLVTLQSLGDALRGGLEGFRGDHGRDAERLRAAVDEHLEHLGRRLASFNADTTKHHTNSQEALYTRLTELARLQGDHQEKLRNTVEQRLDRLNETNTGKLEEMRATVDEKLHATLQSRLTESFGAVTDQLTRVHTGLGEMSKLSAGVDDLSRIFTNVKSRGGFAEVQLGMLLAQMLAPAQYSQNVRVKPNTAEAVEYAVRLPTATGEAWLPIDAKFPREAWERLETAYAEGSPGIGSAGRAFEAAIRTEGRRIADKYIAPPATTNFAIMFLPTEGLYAEVMRRDGLQTEIQASCRVTIAGPSTLSAILNSFQMGFHMLQLQQKGDEVWKVLASARVQFGKFEDLMTRMDDQVGKVQKTLQEVGVRTRAINRSLRDVQMDEEATAGTLRDARGEMASGLVPLPGPAECAVPAGERLDRGGRGG